MPPPQTDGGCRRCETKTLKQITHLHQTEFASPSVFLKRKDIFNNDCWRGRGLVGKWKRGRNSPPPSIPPPSRRAFLEVSSWSQTWAAALSKSASPSAVTLLPK